MPDNLNFNVYYDGWQQAKLWLVTNEDFVSMYSKYRTGEITHWCDCCQNKSGTQKQVYPDDKRRWRLTQYLKTLRKNMATTLIHQGCDCGLEYAHPPVTIGMS